MGHNLAIIVVWNQLFISLYGIVMDVIWRAPKFLVRLKKGPTMLKSGSSWNLVPLPASNTKRGWEGHAESSEIRLGRGTSYLVTRSCIQNQPTSWLVHIENTLGVDNKPRATLDSLDSPRPGLRGSHHLPPYSILCVTLPHLHPNGFFSQDSQSGVPKLSRFGLLGLWAFITSCSDLRLGWGLKQTCSSLRELSNNVSHSTCTHQGQVDSWLFMVGSQTGSLTPSLSFDHNLCCRCPNGSCEAILDIYTSRPFQRYKKHLRVRCFDPCNWTLNFWESRRTLKSHFRECEWRPHTSLKMGLQHHSFIYIVWTSMSCALFRHKCHMLVHIIYTHMLYVYSCYLHTKVVHMTSMFK
jgi:hypothetical protein